MQGKAQILQKEYGRNSVQKIFIELAARRYFWWLPALVISSEQLRFPGSFFYKFFMQAHSPVRKQLGACVKYLFETELRHNLRLDVFCTLLPW